MSSEADIVLLLARAEDVKFVQAVARGSMRRLREGRLEGRKPCVVRLSGAESFVQGTGARGGERLSVSSRRKRSRRVSFST